MSEEFYESLVIAPDEELTLLRTTAQEYMQEADQKVKVAARLLQLTRKLEERKNYIYLELRDRKEQGEKGLTEAAISAAISVDKLVQSLQSEIDKYKLADLRQGHRLEAIRMKHSALKVMAEALIGERRGTAATR